MRELKFRAWDKVYSRYFEDSGFPRIEELSIRLDGTPMIMANTLSEDGVPASKRFEIEQWTGIHDGNGKKIFEGDIVKWHTEDPDRIFVVSMGFVYDDDGFTWPCWMVPAKYEYSECYGHYSEIIGNVHETPELLK